MIRELKTLLAVAREGTFAAAGDKIGLTQAAVSAQMQRLEEQLGFALFARTGRSARINAVGRRALAQAQEVIRLFDNLGIVPAGEHAAVLLRVGAIASVQKGRLADALTQFHKALPACRTHVVPGVSMRLLDRLDAGEIDLAVMIRPPFALQGDLHWTTLAHEPFRLIVPRRTRGQDWAELLSTLPFVRYERTSFGGRQVERFLHAAQIAVREVSELDELDAIHRLVANGVGVSLVPETGLQGRWPAGIRAVDLGQHTFHRDIGLVLRRDLAPDAPAQVLVRALRTTYGAREAPAKGL